MKYWVPVIVDPASGRAFDRVAVVYTLEGFEASDTFAPSDEFKSLVASDGVSPEARSLVHEFFGDKYGW